MLQSQAGCLGSYSDLLTYELYNQGQAIQLPRAPVISTVQ